MVLVTELMDGCVLVSGRGSSRELSSSREHIGLWEGPEAGRKGWRAHRGCQWTVAKAGLVAMDRGQRRHGLRKHSSELEDYGI